MLMAHGVAIRTCEALLAQREQQVLQDHRVHKVTLVLQALKARQAQRGMMERQVPKVQQVLQAQQDRKVLLDLQVLRVLLAPHLLMLGQGTV